MSDLSCPACGGDGNETEDSLTVYGIHGGWVTTGPRAELGMRLLEKNEENG